MTDEVEIKSETKVERKGETEQNLENAGDKIKAGAKALGKKIEDPDRALRTEYNREKFKENVD